MAQDDRVRTHLNTTTVALAVYTVCAAFSAVLSLQNDRPVGLVAVALIPAAIWLRAKPLWFVGTLILGGAILRLAFFGVLDADGLAISHGALDSVLAGGNPYTHGYAVSVPPGAPFVYGPLALITAIPGAWVELIAGIATMALMGTVRSWVALAIYATAPLVTTMTMSGTNDVLPGLLIAAGLLAIRWRPWVGAVLVALAAGIKPYAFAWFPAIIALGGVPALVALVGVTAVAWGPLLVWGIGPYLNAVDLARQFHLQPQDALNLPEWRPLAAIPFVIGLFSRSWLAGVMLGAAVFVLVLFLDRWASVSYWLALAPILLIAGEESVGRVLTVKRDGLGQAKTPPEAGLTPG
jgi:hypothetical protein